MADNTTLNAGAGGDVIATDDVAGVKYQRVKLVDGTLDSTAVIPGDATNGLWVNVKAAATTAVTGPLTDAQLRASAVPVSGPLTDAQLRASVVPVDTELPAAAALADTTANPTTSVIEAMLACYNGTTWDRLRGDITNGLDVDVTRVSGTVTIAGAVTNAGTFAVQDSQVIADNAPFTDGTSKVFPVGLVFDEVAGTALTENDVAAPRIDSKRATIGVIEDATTRGQRATVSAANALKVDGSAVTQPVSGTVTANAGTGPFPISDNAGSITVDAAAATFGVNDAQIAGTAYDVNSGNKSAGTQRVTLATDQVQLTNALKVDGSAVTQPVSLTSTSLIPLTTGGLTIFHLISAASTNATNVKASAGQLYGWFIRNTNATTNMKVAFHNTAGTPTAGASVIFSVNIPAGSAANVFGDIGLAFATGIGITTVTGTADTDATAVAVNDLDINLFYK
jgi:hypothetical protein